MNKSNEIIDGVMDQLYSTAAHWMTEGRLNEPYEDMAKSQQEHLKEDVTYMRNRLNDLMELMI